MFGYFKHMHEKVKDFNCSHSEKGYSQMLDWIKDVHLQIDKLQSLKIK